MGAGFAGLSAAVRLARDGARVLVLEARARLGGRATAFRGPGDRRAGGQRSARAARVLHARRCRSCVTSARATTSAAAAAERDMIDRDGVARGSSAPGCRRRCICSPACSSGRPSLDAIGCRSCGWRTPLRMARRDARGRRTADRGVAGRNRRELAGSTADARLREMLWEPLALAALNQPPSVAAAPPFARVLGEMFGGDPRRGDRAADQPLDAMYAEPARAYIESHGGDRADGRAGDASASRPAASRRHRPARTSWPPRRGLSRRALVRARRCCSRATLSPLATAPRRAARDGVVTDRDGESLVRPAGDRRAVRGPAGPRDAVGVRQAAGSAAAASHLSLVSSGAAPLLDRTNAELDRRWRIGELLEALPRARASTAAARRGRSASRARRSRWRPVSRSVRPRDRRARALLAGDWIATGLPATIESAVRSGHRRRRVSGTDRRHRLTDQPMTDPPITDNQS